MPVPMSMQSQQYQASLQSTWPSPNQKSGTLPSAGMPHCSHLRGGRSGFPRVLLRSVVTKCGPLLTVLVLVAVTNLLSMRSLGAARHRDRTPGDISSTSAAERPGDCATIHLCRKGACVRSSAPFRRVLPAGRTSSTHHLGLHLPTALRAVRANAIPAPSHHPPHDGSCFHHYAVLDDDAADEVRSDDSNQKLDQSSSKFTHSGAL